uniref:Polyketide synthase n=1 Tax=Peronospora matthiolae TaxID=2874970 RepID=A0AAV1V2R4_9STRA
MKAWQSPPQRGLDQGTSKLAVRGLCCTHWSFSVRALHLDETVDPDGENASVCSLHLASQLPTTSTWVCIVHRDFQPSLHSLEICPGTFMKTPGYCVAVLDSGL